MKSAGSRCRHDGAHCLRAVVRALATVAVVSAALDAQAVRGWRIMSTTDGSAVEGAEVRVPARALLARSDANGMVSLRAVPGDSITVRRLGFARLDVRLPDDGRIVLTPLPTTLPELVTTAGLREMRRGDSPASVTVLDRAAIDAAAAVSADQLLRSLPGLQQIASPPAQTSIAIRGLDAARVLVLVDGEPVAGAQLDNRDIGRLSTLAAERIEVTKGPSSVEFGSDALGGVINLVTAAPAPKLNLIASARGGGLGRREADAEASNTWGPLGVRINAGWRETDRVTGVAAEGTTLDRVRDLRADARWRLTPRISLRADVSLAQQRQRWPVGSGFNGFIDNTTAQGLIEALAPLAGGQLRVRGFAQRYAYRYRQARALIPIAGSADSLEQDETLLRALTSWSRRAGAHLIDAGVQLASRSIVAPTKIDGDSAHDAVTEIFLRDAWTHDRVLLTAGARSTSSTLWGSVIAPSFGAAYQASPTWRLRANIARGYRAPGFKEMRYTFLNAAAGYVVEGNADLRPESSWASTIGATWAAAPALMLSLEAYRNEVRDLIATRNVGTNEAGLLVFRGDNVSRARTEGIETALQWSRASGTVTFGYDFLRAVDLETRRTIDGRARHTARLTAARRWSHLRGSSADLSARYTGSSPLGSGRQAAFLTTDAQLRVGQDGMLEGSLAVTNLFDVRPAGWTPAFQRQLLLGLRMRMARGR